MAIRASHLGEWAGRVNWYVDAVCAAFGQDRSNVMISEEADGTVIVLTSPVWRLSLSPADRQQTFAIVHGRLISFFTQVYGEPACDRSLTSLPVPLRMTTADW
jgi:hypothetical protein